MSLINQQNIPKVSPTRKKEDRRSKAEQQRDHLISVLIDNNQIMQSILNQLAEIQSVLEVWMQVSEGTDPEEAELELLNDDLDDDDDEDEPWKNGLICDEDQ